MMHDRMHSAAAQAMPSMRLHQDPMCRLVRIVMAMPE